MIDVALRPATPADADAVARIWREGWRDGHLGHVPAALVEVRNPDSFAQRAADRVADTTVAVVAGEVAGFTMVVGDEVEQVYVSRTHRGAGVAPKLLADARRAIGAAGHAVAWLAVATGNDRARRFYRALRVDRRGGVRLRGRHRIGQHAGAVSPLQCRHVWLRALRYGAAPEPLFLGWTRPRGSGAGWLRGIRQRAQVTPLALLARSHLTSP